MLVMKGGAGQSKAVYLKSVISPYDEDISATDVDKALDEIVAVISVIFYLRNDNE